MANFEPHLHLQLSAKRVQCLVEHLNSEAVKSLEPSSILINCRYQSLARQASFPATQANLDVNWMVLLKRSRETRLTLTTVIVAGSIKLCKGLNGPLLRF